RPEYTDDATSSGGGNIYSLDNSGNITATAEAEDAAVYVAGVGSFSYAESGAGTATSSGGNIYSLTNSGNIKATGTSPYFAEVYGVYAYSEAESEESEVFSSGGNIYNLINSGDITAEATVTGIMAKTEIPLQGPNAVVSAVSTLSYTYSGGSGDAVSSGGNIYSLENSGDITATGTSNYEAKVSGVSVYSGANISDGYATSSGGNIENLTNSGDITATGTADYYVDAYGLSAYSEAYNGTGEAYSSGGNIYNLTNSGNISATAIAISEEVDSVEVPLQGSEAYAYGVFVYSYAYGDSYSEASGGNITNLNNSGTISARAEGVDAYASGIYAEVSDGDSVTGGNIIGLSNSGDII
ncbi:MAG TPA: hypothetical protein PLQ41_09570, partial [bacterium]|nr:hypothetical protein [bacterium]